MPGPIIGDVYGNRSPSKIKDFYSELMAWAPEGGASWGATTAGTMPPNMYDFGVVKDSPEEEKLMRLILAAMGNEAAFKNYLGRSKKGAGKKTSSTSAADAIIGNDL